MKNCLKIIIFGLLSLSIVLTPYICGLSFPIDRTSGTRWTRWSHLTGTVIKFGLAFSPENSTLRFDWKHFFYTICSIPNLWSQFLASGRFKRGVYPWFIQDNTEVDGLLGYICISLNLHLTDKYKMLHRLRIVETEYLAGKYMFRMYRFFPLLL